MRSLRGSYRLIGTRLWLGTVFTALLMCGCSGGAKPPKPVAVTGQVLFEGRPLANAEVVFLPVGGAAKSSAVSDAEGRFTPTTFSAKDGLLEGEYVVLVSYRPIVGKGDNATAGRNALPARFSDPGQSPLKVRVANGATELEPLHVTRR